jgi:eukaryotic-like serine/threonine-protein kinase
MGLPERIRDYEIWGRLGEGGMSEVWLAKHTVLAIPVILKVLRPAFAATEAKQEAHRVLDEARLMARITNPLVVRAIDAGVHENLPYLVQEYVDGIDMAELDKRRRASLGIGLPLWYVVHVTRQACIALHAAHQAGVVHRDVKPSNLFGAPETGVRLGDFGIATGTAKTARDVSGTLHFMAPEQLSEGATSRGTDVWGAAATACDLRYGKPPFAEVAHTLDPSMGPQMPAPRSPEEAYFQHVLRGMLAKDPDQRPRDLIEPVRHFTDLLRSVRAAAHRTTLVYLDRHTFRIGECTINFTAGNLADAQTDGIVSSANYKMQMQSGVGEALRKKGGDVIEVEATEGGERALGTCIATRAGTLDTKYVLHAVSAWNETSCVGRATQRALLLADELGLRSLAFPALGTGAARVTMETCANAMMTALRWHLMLGGTRLRHVQIILADEAKLAIFREVAEDSLRAEEQRGSTDLGLSVMEGEVRGDSLTQVAPDLDDSR